jgi:hypothetical protein
MIALTAAKKGHSLVLVFKSAVTCANRACSNYFFTCKDPTMKFAGLPDYVPLATQPLFKMLSKEEIDNDGNSDPVVKTGAPGAPKFHHRPEHGGK